MQHFFRTDLNLSSYSANLSQARNIEALAPIDSGRKVVTCEDTVTHDQVIDAYFLNVYDLEDEIKFQECAFVK